MYISSSLYGLLIKAIVRTSSTLWNRSTLGQMIPAVGGPTILCTKLTDRYAVLYIPAVPTTPQNADYIRRQAEHFKKGIPPPDFPKDNRTETGNIGLGMENDLLSDSGKRAMGLVH